MKNAHRLADGTPHGATNVATVHQNSVFIEGKLAARVTDQCTCGAPITAGSPTVLIANQQAARIGDPIACPGNLVVNTAQRTFIGDSGSCSSSLNMSKPNSNQGPTSASEPNSSFQVNSGFPPSILAFLDTIAWAEGTDPNGNGGGYDVGFNYRKIEDFTDHPRTAADGSSAAGRYQFLRKTWDQVKKEIKLPDFSPVSQDKGAAHLLRKHGISQEMIESNLTEAIRRASHEWSSFPNPQTGMSRHLFNGKHQKARNLTDLKNTFQNALKNRSKI